jgi:hypothetical protein
MKARLWIAILILIYSTANCNAQTEQSIMEPQTTTQQDTNKKKINDFCTADSECDSGFCERSSDATNKMYYIDGIFCGVHPDLTSTMASNEAEQALSPLGCKRLSFEIRNPDPVIKTYVGCPKDMQVKECAIGKCNSDPFHVTPFDDNRCTMKKLDSDGRLRR